MTNGGFFRRALIGSAATAVVLTSGMVLPANAQIEEIVVTAQRRSENLQTVPISVSVASGETLDTMFIAGDDILAMAARFPSLYIESSNGRVAPRFYIRGLGNIDFDLAASQPVPVIVDEVVLENVVLKSSPIFDIQQVEVLRGPQGTLFGRNTTAGIVKFTTNKPTQEQEGYLSASYGTFGTTTIEGAMGGGLSDAISVRGSVLYQSRDDWIDNTYTGESDALGNFNEIAGRLQLLLEPSDDLSVLFNIHGRSLEGTAAIFRANILGPGNNDLNSNFDRDKVGFDGGDNNPQDYVGAGASMRIDWNMGGATLTSITAYEDTHGFSRGDIDGGNFVTDYSPNFIPFPSDTQDNIDELGQFTQEIRIASQDTDGYSWQFGAFYFDGDFTITTDPGFTVATVKHENTAWAIFGQGTYDVSDDLTVTAGLRYTDDEKDMNVLVWPVWDPAYLPVSVSDEQVSWDVSAMYTVNDQFNVYGRVASGFRGPSIQGRDVAFSGAPTTADSETIMSYEVGFKAETANRQARLNMAAFYYVIDDMQLTAVGAGGNLIQLLNAKEGIGMGFEGDIEYAPVDSFLMTLGFSYNNTEINDSDLLVGICGFGQCTVTDNVVGGFAEADGNPFPQAPEIILNATARYGIELENDHELFFYTDWSYQGDTNFFLYESKEFNSDGQFEGGLKIGLRKNDGSYELALFARNITDEENVKGGIDFNNLTGFVNEPRVWGVSFRGEF